ncbi:ECF transporter S component [Erysipelotrichaceae bacterium OttesenSCG-928-M19]|nr:ECF transporter S component [Erysipelotrichaceae bacterium OttesenSCG-928-M19]
MNIYDLRKRSTTQKMVFTAILGCIAFLLNYLELPFIVPHLRFDLSEAVVLFTVMLLGLKYGLAISFIKAFLFFLFGANGSEIVGVSILLFSSCFLAIVFSLLYEKGKLNLYASLAIMGLIFAVTLTAVNYFITIPLYSGTSFSNLNASGNYLWATVSLYFPFNIIKMILISIVLVILQRLLLKNSVQK